MERCFHICVNREFIWRRASRWLNYFSFLKKNVFPNTLHKHSIGILVTQPQEPHVWQQAYD